MRAFGPQSIELQTRAGRRAGGERVLDADEPKTLTNADGLSGPPFEVSFTNTL